MEVRIFCFLQIILLVLCAKSVQNYEKHLNLLFNSNKNRKDTFLNSEHLITKYGYPFESHRVVTEDGYIVNLFRIPSNGPPVLLVHGIGDSSDSWLVLGPPNSLAYLLKDAGFDVWLYNARGNKYSKSHTRNLSSKQYWNFSYEEMGSQDLPAVIDYILRSTYQHKLSYVGFSQGTTVFLVLCSLRPNYNEKINHAVLLAPVAWTTSLGHPLIDILAPNLNLLWHFVENFELFELFSDSRIRNAYHAKVCNSNSEARILCELEFYLSYGFKDIKSFSSDRFPVVASHIPAGASAKTFVHFMQGYVTKKFQRFNYYTPGENVLMYESPEPPSYNISLVTAPVTLIASEIDWYSTPKDVHFLDKRLPSIVNYVIFNKTLDFSHLEFVYGARAKTLVNDPVVSLLKTVY